MLIPAAERSPASPGTTRVFGLDLLRAIAILMIVYIHAMAILSGVVDPDVYLLPATDSVSMFFVLSGYLIGRILIKTFIEQRGDRRALVQFWIFRWFRTLPSYYLILTINILMLVYSGVPIPPSTGLFYVFLQNFAWPHPSFFGEAWSLSVEEWFYLLMPLAMIGVLWNAPHVAAAKRRLLILLAVVALASIAARLPVGLSGLAEDYGVWDDLIRKVVVTRFDALVIGVFGAYLSIYRPDLWKRHTRLLAVLGVGLVVLDRLLFSQYMVYAVFASLTVLPLATLLMMPYLSQLSCRRTIATDLVEWISRRSYAMYLVNLTLTYSILNLIPFGWAGAYAVPVKYAAFWVMVFALSAALHRLWEMPMMNLRERFRLSAPVHAYGGPAVASASPPAEPERPLPAGLPGRG